MEKKKLETYRTITSFVLLNPALGAESWVSSGTNPKKEEHFQCRELFSRVKPNLHRSDWTTEFWMRICIPTQTHHIGLGNLEFHPKTFMFLLIRHTPLYESYIPNKPHTSPQPWIMFRYEALMHIWFTPYSSEPIISYCKYFSWISVCSLHPCNAVCAVNSKHLQIYYLKPIKVTEIWSFQNNPRK